jgi:hypothetical protein
MSPGTLQAASLAGCPGTVSLRTHYNGSDVPQTTDFYVAGTGGTFYSTGTQGSFSLIVADANPVAFNPMPAGTTVSVTATTGLSATVLGGSPVPSTPYPTGLGVSFKFDDTTSSGAITFTTTTPKGVAVSSGTIFLVRGAATGTVVACP